MSHSGTADLNLDAVLLELTLECPSGGNPEQCPLCHIRHLPIADRHRYTRALSPEDKAALFDYHQSCSRNLCR
jgi:hypothetical protein